MQVNCFFFPFSLIFSLYLFHLIYSDQLLFLTKITDMWLCALTGLLIFVAALHGSPLNTNTDVITPNENGLVYVFSIYVVKNTKSDTVGKMLSHKSLNKIPAIFEPIGNIIMADDEPEPFTLIEFAEFLEDYGITVNKIDDEKNPKVIEVKLDDFMDESDEILSLEDIVKILQDEGIIIRTSHESGARILHIEFDESVRLSTAQPFTLEELADYFEYEGFTVDLVMSNNTVKSIKIELEMPSEENDNKEHVELPSTTARIDDTVMEKKIERRPELNVNVVGHKNDKKFEHDDDRIFPLNFVTRSDSMNEIIRKQRSVSFPECKTANLIKKFINNYFEN